MNGTIVSSCAIIFAGGSLPDLEPARRFIDSSCLLIAADGGARHALALGLTPAVIIGDLDSLLPTDRQQAERQGARLLQYPTDKDETDLELALDYALQQNCTRILVVAAFGGRLDQTLANLSLLTDPRFAGLDLRLDDGVEEAFFTRRSAQVRGRAGDLVSLLPWGGPVTGIRTHGLRWALSGETLLPHKTRGISNEMLGPLAEIEIQSGLLLVIHRRLLPLAPDR